MLSGVRHHRSNHHAKAEVTIDMEDINPLIAVVLRHQSRQFTPSEAPGIRYYTVSQTSVIPAPNFCLIPTLRAKANTAFADPQHSVVQSTHPQREQRNAVNCHGNKLRKSTLVSSQKDKDPFYSQR